MTLDKDTPPSMRLLALSVVVLAGSILFGLGFVAQAERYGNNAAIVIGGLMLFASCIAFVIELVWQYRTTARGGPNHRLQLPDDVGE